MFRDCYYAVGCFRRKIMVGRKLFCFLCKWKPVLWLCMDAVGSRGPLERYSLPASLTFST
jgi:hypothetical protein